MTDKEKRAHDIAIALLQCVYTGTTEITASTAFEAAKTYLVYYKNALNSLEEDER